MHELPIILSLWSHIEPTLLQKLSCDKILEECLSKRHTKWRFIPQDFYWQLIRYYLWLEYIKIPNSQKESWYSVSKNNIGTASYSYNLGKVYISVRDCLRYMSQMAAKDQFSKVILRSAVNTLLKGHECLFSE
jgi:hypothetical protein